VGRRVLDQGIMSKLAKKLRKPGKSISVMVSKKAHKLGSSPEAALIVLAKENGIGTAVYQRSLEPAKQAEVRDALPSIFASSQARPERLESPKHVRTTTSIGRKASLRAAIEFLIEDPVLLSRCKDILLAKSKFDRPINQATQVLEDRIRNKAQPTAKLTGENLVGFAFNEDLSRTVLRVQSNVPEDQRGFTQILKGIVPAFRNKTHHHVTDSFTQQEAIRVVAFIDVLLRVVDSSIKVK
jgi:uncharacterized protein (TIGR02391 family)